MLRKSSSRIFSVFLALTLLLAQITPARAAAGDTTRLSLGALQGNGD